MMFTRAKPIVATAAVALSLAACQWMGGERSQQTSAAPKASMAAQQSVSPAMVRSIQQRLNDRGYDAGATDGVWGESTASALSKFQRDQRLEQSGAIDMQTLAALGVTGAPSGMAQAAPSADRPYTATSRRGAEQPAQKSTIGRQSSMRQEAAGMNTAQVRDLQQQLQQRGYDPGKIDGQWGNNTRQALMNFQRDQNINATGRPDNRTLAALGIERGSQQVGQMPTPRPAHRQPTPQDIPSEEPPAPDIGPSDQQVQ